MKMSLWQKMNTFFKKYHIIKSLFALGLFVFLLFSSYLVYLAKTTNVEELQVSLSHQTIILDENGEEVGRLSSQKGTYVTLEDVAPSFIDAVIATEDQHFYEHKGIDMSGILRAVLSFFTRGFSLVGGGGSTLTQQLAKNAYLTQRQSLIRKFQELFLAIEIEKVYDKNTILTMYINKAYFGNGVWGVEDASLKYFGKHAKDLTVSESAVLAGMLKGPNLYNPYDDLTAALNRRDTVLSRMLITKKISQEEHDEAATSELVLVDKYDARTHYQYPYYFDAVIDEAIAQYGISEENLLTNGYKIYTALNTEYQNALETAVQNDSLFPENENTLVQTAAIVSDPKTGGIKALIGGRGEHVYRGFNRAYQMYRQPGSVLKPLVVYTSAIELGYTPRSVLLDEVISYGSDRYTPYNWNYETVGNIPMYQALALSKNTSAVWLLNEIGIDKGLEKLKLFGIETEPNDNYLGIALGGMTKGTTLKAINEAYGAFANDGVRMSSFLITKIEDASGQVIVNKTFTNQTTVMSAETAKTMTQMMMGVYQEGGTAPFQTYNNLLIAGKTGTTESIVDSSDMWATGYTKDFVYTTWIGYDQTTSENYLKMAQGDSIKPLFNFTVNELLKASEQTPFDFESITSEVKQEEIKQQQKNWFNNLQDNVQKAIDGTLDAIKGFFNKLFP